MFILTLTFLTLILPSTKIYASESSIAKIGNNFYDNLENAIKAASNNDTITLTSNINLDNTLKINKTINLNLNNNNIEATQQVFLIEGGSLNLTGNGTIKETKPYYGAITLKGSEDPTKENYSTVSVGENITLEGWSGVFIDHNDNNTGYGILVNIDGKINAVNDINGGTGIGIYVNGKIKHEDNSPIINLNKTAHIKSTGNGIYSAGYSIYNINGAHIEGEESALGIKSGIFNINDATIIGTGPDKTPTNTNNNGINASGTAIQIESNSGYKGNIELNIKNGTIKSKNSHVIYEYTKNNTNTKVKKINLSGGTYTSDTNKNVFLLSDSFKNTHPHFISGGTYSSDPSPYLESGYSSTKDNSIYKVLQNTISVFKETNKLNNYPIIITIITLSIITIIFLLYKRKILNKIYK